MARGHRGPDARIGFLLAPPYFPLRAWIRRDVEAERRPRRRRDLRSSANLQLSTETSRSTDAARSNRVTFSAAADSKVDHHQRSLGGLAVLLVQGERLRLRDGARSPLPPRETVACRRDAVTAGSSRSDELGVVREPRAPRAQAATHAGEAGPV